MCHVFTQTHVYIFIQIEECVKQWNGKERVQGENAVGAATATHSAEEPQEPFVLSCVRNASSSLALSVAVSSVEHLSSAFSALSGIPLYVLLCA